MGDKLFVGNLSFDLKDEDLKAAFAQFGEIKEASIIINKFNGRSKGFGFVTFASEADAQKAVAEMNGKELGGRQLTVSEAKPFDPSAERPRRSFGGDRGGRGGGFGGGRSFGGDRGGRRERY
jgi:RNA recognition motif-containing protein